MCGCLASTEGLKADFHVVIVLMLISCWPLLKQQLQSFLMYSGKANKELSRLCF